jgi:Contractile injection system tube protein
MTTFPRSPKLLRGGLVLLHPTSGAILRTIALQYNPDTLTRTLQVQGTGAQGGAARSEALRLKGPPAESIRVEAEIDATDQLEHPDTNQAGRLGLHPQLAALEMIVYPASATEQANHALAGAGTLEIAPVEAPLTLFVWSAQRILPVRLTEFTITEEAFDPNLNPIRAKVTLGLHVLSVNDLPFDHKGTSLFLVHQQQKERLAASAPAGTLGTLGVSGIP